MLTSYKGTAKNILDNDPNRIVDEMLFEIQNIQKEYDVKYGMLYSQLSTIKDNLATATQLDKKVDLL